MLFELNSNNSNYDDISFEYFNLPMNNFNINMDSHMNIFDLKTGLSLGNIYINEYKPYKNFMPKKISVNNDREKMLLKIQELDFALNDLNLKLDINPEDKELYKLFKNYAIELKNLCEQYSKEVEVLELIKDVNGKYTWINDPWPWDGGKKNV